MARDSGGTYTLPTNSFAQPVEGTVIDEVDAAATLDDIETALTDSLSKSGKGKVTAHVDLDEISAPASPASNVGRLYVEDVGGVTTLKFKDSGGTSYNLLTAAASGLSYTFNSSTNTSADPGSGKVALNDSTLADVTEIAVDDSDANGADVSAFVLTWDDVSGTNRGTLIVQNRTAPANVAIFTVSAASTDESGWTRLAVTYVTHAGSFSNLDPLSLSFMRTGTTGATGLTGVSGGIVWNFDSSTSMADPGSGDIRLDNASFSSVTAAAISANCGENGNPDVHDYVAAWDDSTTTGTRGYLIIKKTTAQENFAIYSISGALTDNTSWLQLALTYINGAGSFSSGDDLAVQFVRTGDKGTAGTDGTSAGIKFTFDTTTSMADPGSGDIRLNNATLSSVTAAAVSDLSADSGNPDVSAFVLSWDDSTTSANRGTLIIRKVSAPENFAIYTISGASTDNSGWTELALTYVGHNGSFSAADVLTVAFARSGNSGAGSIGGSTGSDDNRLIRSDGTGGTDIQATGITVDDSDNVSGMATLTLPNTGLHLLDTDASHDLIVKPGSNITADRTLTVTTGDADRTLSVSGDATVSQDYSTTGNPQFATIELGAASDTTLSRTGAGAIAVEGVGVALNSTSLVHTASTIELGHASDTTLSRAAAGRLAVEGVQVLLAGKQTIWVPAAAMVARTTNGAAPGTVETTTNKNMIKTLDFDASTQEFAQFEIAMPKSWDESTVTFQPIWSHAATTTNFGVVWVVAGVATSDDDAMDAAFGTGQTSSDTGGTTNDRYIGPESSAITIAGTPAEGDVVQFQVARVPSDGNDTMAIDARLHGVKLYITTNAATDA